MKLKTSIYIAGIYHSGEPLIITEVSDFCVPEYWQKIQEVEIELDRSDINLKQIAQAVDEADKLLTKARSCES